HSGGCHNEYAVLNGTCTATGKVPGLIPFPAFQAQRADTRFGTARPRARRQSPHLNLSICGQHMMRSHYCGAVNASAIDDTVTVCGWVHRRRDHGGVIFVDLRDHTGLLQVVFDPDVPDMFAVAERLRNEYVIRVTGRVRPRPEGTVNPELASGEIEVESSRLEVLNEARTPPLQVDEADHVSDAARLRHRYIELRKPRKQAHLRQRAEVKHI